VGTVVGVLIIAVMSNGLSVLGVQTYWQYIVQGVLLLGAMFGAGVIAGRKV
jgi:ribose transport system permease protein